MVEQVVLAEIENIENELNEPNICPVESPHQIRTSQYDVPDEHERSNQNLDHFQNISAYADELLVPSLAQQNELTANDEADNDEEANFDLASNGAECFVSGNELDPLHIGIDIKPEPLALFDLHNDQIFNVLNDSEPFDSANEQPEGESADNSDADVILVPNENDFPMPQKYNIFALIKRENDEVTGNIPFDEKVCILCSTGWLDIRFVRMN